MTSTSRGWGSRGGLGALEWVPEGDKLVANKGPLRVEMTKSGDRWIFVVRHGEARLSSGHASEQDGAVRAARKSVASALDMLKKTGKCEACDGVTYPYRRTDKLRCLTPTCVRYKK